MRRPINKKRRITRLCTEPRVESNPAVDHIMFNKDKFIEECITAIPEGQQALREIVGAAVSDSAGIISELGEPEHAGITPLYRSDELTIINFTWAPCMNLMPHNHQMYAVIGVYSGREDNVYWRKTKSSIEAAGAKSLGRGDVATLGRNIIHSVINPIEKMTCALHVYGGDFFAPHEPRSEWDHETLEERPWDIEKVKARFQDAEMRFNALA
jgi:predicted metal-dependent enzyme (double-stranded beta helix superfamily)